MRTIGFFLGVVSWLVQPMGVKYSSGSGREDRASYGESGDRHDSNLWISANKDIRIWDVASRIPPECAVPVSHTT